MQDWYLYCSVMSDYLFPKNNIVLPTNGRAPQLCWGKTIYSLGNFALYDRNIIFFYFFLAVAGWRRLYEYFYFYFFYGGASHITGGGCGGLIFFKRSGLFFYFLFFFMVVVAPHWGRVAWVKIKK